MAPANKRKIFPSGWKTYVDTPCPLLAPCSECKELLPITDFYPAANGRKTILGNSVVSHCPQCANKRYIRTDHKKKLFYAAKKRATERGLDFDLSVEDLVVPKECPALGIQIQDYTGTGRGNGNANSAAASVDRIDNSRGYTKENICVVSRRANTLKSDGTVSEFADLLSYILERQQDLTDTDRSSLSRLQAILACTETEQLIQ